CAHPHLSRACRLPVYPRYAPGREGAAMDVTDVPRVDIRVLGPLSVAVDGRTVAIGSPKQRAVLAMLALHRRVSVDALAEALWRGPALADLVDRDFARVAAVRLDEARLDVAEDLADAELAAGRPAAALDTVVPLTRDHPFRERLRGLQMLSLYRLGRQAEALAAYQDLRRTLAEELGLEPTSSVQA